MLFLLSKCSHIWYMNMIMIYENEYVYNMFVIYICAFLFTRTLFLNFFLIWCLGKKRGVAVNNRKKSHGSVRAKKGAARRKRSDEGGGSVVRTTSQLRSSIIFFGRVYPRLSRSAWAALHRRGMSTTSPLRGSRAEGLRGELRSVRWYVCGWQVVTVTESRSVLVVGRLNQAIYSKFF